MRDTQTCRAVDRNERPKALLADSRPMLSAKRKTCEKRCAIADQPVCVRPPEHPRALLAKDENNQSTVYSTTRTTTLNLNPLRANYLIAGSLGPVIQLTHSPPYVALPPCCRWILELKGPANNLTYNRPHNGSIRRYAAFVSTS